MQLRLDVEADDIFDLVSLDLATLADFLEYVYITKPKLACKIPEFIEELEETHNE